MQTPEGEIGRDGGSSEGWEKARKAKDEKGNDSRELLSLSSPDHQSVTSLTRLGLGQDVLQVQNRDQYAGHRTGEGRVVERVHSVYCSNSPLPLSDHNTNDTVSSHTIYQHTDTKPHWLLSLSQCNISKPHRSLINSVKHTVQIYVLSCVLGEDLMQQIEPKIKVHV